MHKKSLEAAAHFENNEPDDNDNEDNFSNCKSQNIQNNQLSDKINKSFLDKKDKNTSLNSALINKNHLINQHLNSSTTINNCREKTFEDETLLNKSMINTNKQSNFQTNNTLFTNKLSQTLINDALHLQINNNLPQQLFQIPHIHNTALIDSTNSVYPLQQFHYNNAI